MRRTCCTGCTGIREGSAGSTSTNKCRTLARHDTINQCITFSHLGTWNTFVDTSVNKRRTGARYSTHDHVDGGAGRTWWNLLQSFGCVYRNLGI